MVDLLEAEGQGEGDGGVGAAGGGLRGVGLTPGHQARHQAHRVRARVVRLLGVRGGVVGEGNEGVCVTTSHDLSKFNVLAFVFNTGVICLA